MTLVDYRDRVSVLIWAVLVTLAAQRLLLLPARTFSTVLLGSPVAFTVSGSTLLGALLAGLAASGTEAVLRAHPNNRTGQLEGHGAFYALPVALTIVALLLLPSAPSVLYWFVGLVLTGVVLGLAMAGIYYTVDPYAVGYRRARLGLNGLTYGVVLLLFLVVYQTRVRSIVSATEIMLVSGLLALELLRGSRRPIVLVLVYAGIVGLVLGEATWALNYWRLNSLTGGLVLLLLFYNVVGLSTHGIQGSLRRRVLIEFALITIATLGLIRQFSP